MSIDMNREDYTLVTEMSAKKARGYFYKPECYVNFKLPYYVNFKELLKNARDITKGKNQVSDMCKKDEGGKSIFPSRFPDVNHTILKNKNSSFAWRPLQIIHPVLYSELVNHITSEDNWKKLQEFFRERDKSKVKCASLLFESNTSQSDQAMQIVNWWNNVEQETLRRSLDYSFMHQTDISDCYGSIYTHSFEWALAEDGRLGVKKEREGTGKSSHNLGTEIDTRLRNMNQNQTNGIPQGSALMDFLAEIILGGVDIELTERINEDASLKGAKGANFKIIRYRDDYRILSTENYIGHQVMKLLSDVLMKWNFKMNNSKTFQTDDIISSAIKQEKRDEVYEAPARLPYQKEAMRIFLLSRKYPGTGLISKQLAYYYNRINRKKPLKNIDYEATISIIAMIAYYSPNCISSAAGIITKLIEKSEGTVSRGSIVERIIEKFADIPNTEFVDIWLQRIMDGSVAMDYEFSNKITKVIAGDKGAGVLWNSKWLTDEYQERLNVKISTLKEDVESGKFSPVMEQEEFQIFDDIPSAG